MMIIWCVVALAALGGLYFAIRARAIRGRKHPEVSSEVSAELIRRADQQNRWALRGDTRGVYGASGAELMRSISPEPNIDAELTGRSVSADRRRRLHAGKSRRAAGREAALLAVGCVRLGVGATARRAGVAAV